MPPMPSVRDDDDWPSTFGSDVAQDDAAIGRAGGPRGQHEIAFTQAEHIRPDDAGIARPDGDADHDDDRLQARAEDRRQGDSSTSSGKAIRVSVMRESSESIQPPK